MGDIQHIAFVMDGNRRWAKEKGVPGSEGHREGVKNLKKIIDHVKDKGIKYMTVYALSVENLKRTKVELDILFRLLESFFQEEIDKFVEKGIKFKAFGRTQLLPEKLQKIVLEAEARTAKCDKFFFSACLAYDGQDEIVDAVKRIIEDKIEHEDIDRDMVKKFLYTADIPSPDVIVRTGMYPEQRLSGFLLWDSSYAEFAFTKTTWPGFTTAEFDKIIDDFNSRERRKGK